jgi:putative nucleotidyltransferase with HDIG domain
MSAHAIREAERTQVSRAERGRPMGYAVRRGELIVGGSFLLAALALPLIAGVTQAFSLTTAALYVAAFALAGQVRFDVGAGFTVPTQAIFVPMLFAVPLSLVPLLVALALALGIAPRIISGRMAPSWLLTVPGNSWFACGPAFVLLLANDHSPDGRWGVLLLALGAQFACDFGASAVRERHFHAITFRELAAEVRPIYAIDLALSPMGLAIAFLASAVHHQWAIFLFAPLFGVLRLFSKERDDRLNQLVELNDAYQGTALLLGDVVEADDRYTGEHSKSVVRLALEVAEELGIDADRKRNVEFGALLHDVGKIAVPKEIINKPGKLDEREWAIIKTHTLEGQKMLEKIGGFMREIGGIVRASHERWDGTGYPDGLSGNAIPIEARIVSACDAFNAMTTTRSYRKAMPLSDAIAELKKCEGSQFDPRVVHALLNVVARSDASVSHESLRDFLDDKTPAAPAVAIVAGAAPSAVRRRTGLRAKKPSRGPASSSRPAAR